MMFWGEINAIMIQMAWCSVKAQEQLYLYLGTNKRLLYQPTNGVLF